MASPRRPPVGLLTATALAAGALVALGAAGPAAAAPAVYPNLVPDLSDSAGNFMDFTQVPPSAGGAPEAPDTVFPPGHVLFRFAAGIDNVGDGPLQVFQSDAAGGGPVRQAIYDTSTPPSPPAANSQPVTGANGVVATPQIQETSDWAKDGHDHWHLHDLASYWLTDASGATAASASKVDFCPYDSHAGTMFRFPATPTDPADPTNPSNQMPSNDWCGQILPYFNPNGSFNPTPSQTGRYGGPSQALVQWGLSPNGGEDIYRAVTSFQWMDATDLPAGSYTLHETVNPNGALVEGASPTAANSADNTTTPSSPGAQVTLPGPVVPDAAATDQENGLLTFALPTFTIVGGDMRMNPRLDDPYYKGEAITSQSDSTFDNPLPGSLPGSGFATYSQIVRLSDMRYELVGGPGHGRATIDGLGNVSYTPAPGFSGTDAFTYRVRDAHFGFFSPTATATITVQPAPPAPPPPPLRILRTSLARVGGARGRDVRVTLVLGGATGGEAVVQRRAGKRWVRLLDARRFTGGTVRLLVPRARSRRWVRVRVVSGRRWAVTRPFAIPARRR